MAYGETLSVLNPIPTELILQKLTQCGFADERLLDVGCGRAATLSAIAAGFPEAELCGIDRDAVECSAEKLHISRGNAEALPYPDGFCDLLLSECSFSLIDDEERAAEEIGRVLKPGGLLLLTDLYTGLEKDAKLTDSGLIRNLYTAETICRFFEKNGLRLQDFTDFTPALTDMTIQMVMKDEFCCMSRETWKELKTKKPRYGMWLFRK